jgi:hypothetical protein
MIQKTQRRKRNNKRQRVKKNARKGKGGNYKTEIGTLRVRSLEEKVGSNELPT